MSMEVSGEVVTQNQRWREARSRIEEAGKLKAALAKSQANLLERDRSQFPVPSLVPQNTVCACPVCGSKSQNMNFQLLVAVRGTYKIPEQAEYFNRPRMSLILSYVVKKEKCQENVTQKDLISKTRTRRITEVRHIVFYLCTELTLRSTIEIGKFLGGRDHTTVMSARDKYRRWRLEKPDLDAKLTRYAKEIMEIVNPAVKIEGGYA